MCRKLHSRVLGTLNTSAFNGRYIQKIELVVQLIPNDFGRLGIIRNMYCECFLIPSLLLVGVKWPPLRICQISIDGLAPGMRATGTPECKSTVKYLIRKSKRGCANGRHLRGATITRSPDLLAP